MRGLAGWGRGEKVAGVSIQPQTTEKEKPGAVDKHEKERIRKD